MPPAARPVAERFWSHVDKSGECWLWTMSTDRKGYGVFSLGRGRTVSAHRFAWTLLHGDPGEQHVLHSCDNPPCVRHLFLGDNTANVRDMCAKGRHANTRKTQCPAGHPYDEANTYVDGSGRRRCRTCLAARRRR